MEAYYKISALCLSITVTEKGLVVLPCHSKPSTMPDDKTRVSRFCRRTGGSNKTRRDVIKALDLQSLDIGGTSGLHAHSKAELSLCENLQFLTSVDKHSQRVSFTNGQRNCPEEGETSGLSLSGIRECKYTTNKFLMEHNGGLGRQEDEMRKEDGVSKQK